MDKDKEAYEALSQFSISVFTLNGLLLQSGDLATKPIGQSSARWQVLGRAAYQPQTVAQMARDIGHSRQSVQRLANVLAEEGLVKFVKNPADKRAQLLALTGRGTEVLADIDAREREWSQQLLQKLDANLLAELSDRLDGIGKALVAHINQQRDSS